jgi:hypothetical protein
MAEPPEPKPDDPKDEPAVEAEEQEPPVPEPQRPPTTGGVAPGIFWNPGGYRR